MERSNPNDRADDPSDDGDHDRDRDRDRDARSGYPIAPLPAHERQWRHPSEIGRQAWVLSEPPIALGRGLLVTTGAIGSAIGLAILWMLFPVGGSTPTAEPLVTRSVTTSPPRLGSPGEAEQAGTAVTSSGLVTSSAPISSIGSLPPILTLPAEDVPSNTVLLHSAEPVENAAIAVLIGDSSIMITTAIAVGTDTELSVMLDSGNTGMATVVSITGSLAYLQPAEGTAPDDDLLTVGFATSAAPVAGEVLHVLSPVPVSIDFDGDMQLGDQFAGGVVEGTPVVNDDGALVALCSHDSQGVYLVPVPASPATDPPSTDGSTPDDTTATEQTTSTTIAPTDGQTPAGPGTGTTMPADEGEAWLGIRLASASDGLPGVAVQSVWADSPAADAGFLVGQRILAIDDRTVRTSAEVSAILQDHRPGDLIVVTVSQAPATSTGGAPSTTVLPTATTLAGPTPTSAVAPTTTTRSTTSVPSATTLPGVTATSVGPTTSAPSSAGSTPTSVSPTATTVTSPTAPPSTTTAATSGSSTGTSVAPTVLKISVVLGGREPTV